MATQILYSVKFFLTFKKKIQGSILIDFLLQNNLLYRVYGYI